MNNTQDTAALLVRHTANLQKALEAHAAGAPIDPNVIINLIAALLPGAIGLAQELAAQFGGPARPVEEILAQADVNWQAIADAAKAQGAS